MLSRATTVKNCMKSMQIRDLAGPSRICHFHKREQREYKSLASNGCLHCVGDAEAKVEVFERNQEARQYPHEREECVRRGHI